jgi:type II restriction enzyme
MSSSARLRIQREGTVLNLASQQQETTLGQALKKVVAKLEREFPRAQFRHRRNWQLSEIVDKLKREFPDVPFADPPVKRWLQPDGGILSIVDKQGEDHVILISEIKSQGTNDAIEAEGRKRQAKGNAIERLGKNVIGFRTAMLSEQILPFVCFGDGCDFAPGSYILDRVVTMAMFGPLNEIELHNRGDGGLFNRGSFFFREKAWTETLMAREMHEIANRSIHYYFSKHGKRAFELPSRSVASAR